MESKEYVNPFVDVHRKAEALKKRAHQERQKDEEIRNNRLIKEAPLQGKGKRLAEIQWCGCLRKSPVEANGCTHSRRTDTTADWRRICPGHICASGTASFHDSGLAKYRHWNNSARFSRAIITCTSTNRPITEVNTARS